jgi:hypothetical protein
MAVTLVVEDDVTDVTARKVVAIANPQLTIAYTRVCEGSGLIRKQLPAFNNASLATPYLIITDLDTVVCAPTLVAAWCQRIRLNPGLTFRVAVREVEAWLLADRTAIAQFLGIAVNRVPAYPEQTPDPKRALIQLASTSRYSGIRRAIVPVGAATQGRDYNGCLSTFVNAQWDVHRAAANAPSLAKAVHRIGAIPP